MTKPPEDLEMQVERVAKALPYPPTPDIASRVASRRRERRVTPRLAPAAAGVLIMLLLAFSLLAVPEIRAQVLALLRIGAVEVVMQTATPPAVFEQGETLPASVLDFPGETLLEDAQRHAGYPVLLPAALGTPDRVYLIQGARLIVVLAWLDENGAVDVSLHLLPPSTYGLKLYEGELENVEVNGEAALWLPNPHPIVLRTGSGDADMQTRQVSMHALVWSAAAGGNEITYRLETNRPLEEAISIAESVPVGNANPLNGVLNHDD